MIKIHAKVGQIIKNIGLFEIICIILKGLFISYLPLEQGDFMKTLALLYSQCSQYVLFPSSVINWVTDGHR